MAISNSYVKLPEGTVVQQPELFDLWMIPPLIN